MLLLLFLLVSQHSVVKTISSCYIDRDKDHRPRVNCVGQGLSAVPDGIDPGTMALILSQNAFVSLSWATYTTFPHLHELDLSQNLINTIDQSGSVLVNMSVLRLSNNKLTALGGAAFKSTPSLMEVYLDGNTISSLDDETFCDLPFLELINLSHNKLHILPPHLLECIPSSNLKNFDVEENHIQHLPDEFFASKPDLPYVFLSNNSWVCTCHVTYLRRYLNEQDINIYMHTGPSSIENNPASVVCSAPPTLQGQSIMELEEDEYCGADNKSQHSDTHTTSLMSTLTTTIIQPKIIATISPTTTPQSAESSTTPTPTKTSNNPTTITPATTKPTTPISYILTTTIPSTRPTTIQPTTPTTTEKTTTAVQPTMPQTAECSTTSILLTVPSNNPTTIKSVTMAIQPAGGVFSAHGGGQRLVPWCWWLFITVFLLCIFSAIFSCMLFLWLIITYITIYQPIKQQVCSRQEVTLRAFQVTTDQPLTLDRTEGERVLFLPAEVIRETQPVFRSVLFIAKGDEDGEADERREGTRNEDKGTVTKIDLLPAVTLHKQETETKDREEVFRKTLYRVISREEEIEGWKEVEENCWGMTERDKERREGEVERGKTRYSLILREERGGMMEGRKGEMEWLVGEWEMRGQAQGNWD